jgi:hypothetical protein
MKSFRFALAALALGTSLPLLAAPPEGPNPVFTGRLFQSSPVRTMTKLLPPSRSRALRGTLITPSLRSRMKLTWTVISGRISMPSLSVMSMITT